jgi:hypothetical protein
MVLSEFMKVILIIVLVVGGLWFVGYWIDFYANEATDKRNGLFRKAADDCYDRQGHCDTIFEDLQKDLFPEHTDSRP